MVRYVNVEAEPVTLDVDQHQMEQWRRRGTVNNNRLASSAVMWTLHSNLSGVNTPSEPLAVAPKEAAVADLSQGVSIPGNAFVILSVTHH